MTEETSLAIFDNLPPVTAPQIKDEVQTSLLPYITLVQGLSQLAGPPHQIQAGKFVLHTGKSEFEELGKEFDAFLLDMRYKATRWQDEKMTVITDPDSPLFREFQSLAEANTDGFRWGYEFLLYIGSIGSYATFYCNNISMRIAATQHLAPRMRTVCTVKQDFIEGKTHKWWSVKASDCNEPLAIPPNQEEAIEKIKSFQVHTAPTAIEEDELR